MKYRVDMIIDVPDSWSASDVESFIEDGIVRMSIDCSDDISDGVPVFFDDFINVIEV